MIDAADVNDLQLEDVEDYSTDYPPSVFQKDENLHLPDDGMAKRQRKYRLSKVIGLIRSHKWFAGLLAVLLLVMIIVISLISGMEKAEKNSGSTGSSRTKNSTQRDKPPGQPPIKVDASALDATVTEPLMDILLAAYDRHGIDDIVLSKTAGETPQRLAFFWLATEMDVDSFDHTSLIQRYSLACLYYATNNRPTRYSKHPTPWNEADLWLTSAHACEWQGVQCNQQEHIESINLEDNNLTGSLPQELALIAEHLHTLDFSSNYIYMAEGHFDVFKSLTNLRTLLLDDNFLVSDAGLPEQMKELHKLEKLRLSYNLMAGALEQDSGVLINMRKLTHLELESNFFTGKIPSAIHAMTDLVYLYLRRNDFQSDLSFIKSGNMTKLFAVWLDSNTITGTIPTRIGLLTDLASLSITNSSLTGSIPTEIGQLTGLRRLWLYSNRLSGNIPTQISKLSELEVFEVHDNNLKGSIPDSICTSIDESKYAYKSLTTDCNAVDCNGCCTACF